MTGQIVVDAGPLVAILDRRDQHHTWATARFDGLELPAFTCEAVLAEAVHLLKRVKGGSLAVVEMVKRQLLIPAFDLNREADAVHRLMERYVNVPMSLADACLVRMAELDDRVTILTLDSDFRIYRKHGNKTIPTIMPDDG